MDYLEHERRATAAANDAVEFIDRAVSELAVPRDDWRDALSDAVADLEWIATHSREPDAREHARLALSSVVGMWLDVDQNEQRYLRVVGEL